MDLSDQLLQKDNFIWAWHKVRRYYEATDGWYDEIEVAEFEAQLGSSLDSIRAQFAEGQYFMSAMTPLPQPKKRETSGKPQVRQAFRVKVADQVAWVAWVNVVGPFLERYGRNKAETRADRARERKFKRRRS